MTGIYIIIMLTFYAFLSRFYPFNTTTRVKCVLGVFLDIFFVFENTYSEMYRRPRTFPSLYFYRGVEIFNTASSEPT